MKKRDKVIIYIVLILMLITLISLYTLKALEHYQTWKSHHNYIKNQQQEVQSWMNLKLISETLNISDSALLETLNFNGTKINKHITLEQFCVKYSQNCTKITEELNQLEE